MVKRFIVRMALCQKYWAHRYGFKAWHHAVVVGHAGYFVLVFIEGHGLYTVVAGGLGFLTLVGAIFHLSDD